MHKLIVHKLGPIEHCEIDCKSFMTFTGYQASGKSTLAKAIYFFRTIKDDVMKAVQIGIPSFVFNFSKKRTNPTTIADTYIFHFKVLVQLKFLEIFDINSSVEYPLYAEYQYTPELSLRVSVNMGRTESDDFSIGMDIPPVLYALFEKIPQTEYINDATKEELQQSLCRLFDIYEETSYIPAGRSMLTVLSQQLSYFYGSMKDVQKKSLDYCIQQYIENILLLKPIFHDGLAGVRKQWKIDLQTQYEIPSTTEINLALSLIGKILRGSYRYVNGEERIELDNGQHVKLNYASSGQQEAVWICNLLFYHLVRGTPSTIIIEEPESHLFPSSQKYMTELISLLHNAGHSVIVTTHSPYVLGTMNNLLYAAQSDETIREKASTIIPERLWLDREHFCAWFLQDGQVDDCIDAEMGLIENERIDEISHDINQDFDDLLNLRWDEEGQM